MFGYVRPDINELKVKEYTLYKSVYCGLCRNMKKCTGCLSCFALNYDFVFLALFRSALLGEKIEVSEGRCQFNPLLKRHTAAFPSLEYSAIATSVSVYHKLCDDRADGELGMKALIYPAAVLIKNRAHRSADKSGEGGALNEFAEKAAVSMNALSEAEKSSPSPDEAAEISAGLTAALFEAGLEHIVTFGADVGYASEIIPGDPDGVADHQRHKSGERPPDSSDDPENQKTKFQQFHGNAGKEHGFADFPEFLFGRVGHGVCAPSC